MNPTPPPSTAEFCRDLLGEDEPDVPDDASNTAETDYLSTDSEEEDEMDADVQSAPPRRLQKYKARDGTEWTTAPRAANYENPQPLRVIDPSLKSAAARAASTPAEYVDLFLTAEMIDHIVTCTNPEIALRAARYQSRQYHLGPTDPVEVKTLLGLIILAGVEKSSHQSTRDLWSNIFGASAYRAVMQVNRADFLLVCLRFDKKNTREERSDDKFGKFRHIWNLFTAACFQHYEPSGHLCLDETMYGFRGNCAFKTFIPTKPEKFGLKIISLCDARTFYFLNGVPYLGAEQPRPPPPAPAPPSETESSTRKLSLIHISEPTRPY